MKIMICGKGGSGKSTLTTLIARKLAIMGFRVLVIDCDESNTGIARLLGVNEPVSLLDNLGGKKNLQKKMMAAFPKGKKLELFTKQWRIDDIPDQCLTSDHGIEFMILGKIQHFGEGCACPMGALAKTFLSNLITSENEVVLVDSEAGVEHFGRGVEAGCDLILAIVDPTYESFMMAGRIEELGRAAGKDVYFIQNKVTDEIKDVFAKNINQEKTIASIPLDNNVFINSLQGCSIESSLSDINNAAEFIRDRKTA